MSPLATRHVTHQIKTALTSKRDPLAFDQLSENELLVWNMGKARAHTSALWHTGLFERPSTAGTHQANLSVFPEWGRVSMATTYVLRYGTSADANIANVWRTHNLYPVSPPHPTQGTTAHILPFTILVSLCPSINGTLRISDNRTENSNHDSQPSNMKLSIWMMVLCYDNNTQHFDNGIMSSVNGTHYSVLHWAWYGTLSFSRGFW